MSIDEKDLLILAYISRRYRLDTNRLGVKLEYSSFVTRLKYMIL